MKVAKTEFDYKNCFEGIKMIDISKSKDEILHFNENDVIPEILVPRLEQLNPNYIKDAEVKADSVPELSVQPATTDEEPLMVIQDKDFTESELIAQTKESQIEILVHRGIPQEEIDVLDTERKRVKKIIKTNPGSK